MESKEILQAVWNWEPDLLCDCAAQYGSVSKRLCR